MASRRTRPTSPPVELVCEVDRAEPDAVTVDALARLQLAARRRGCRIRLRNPPAELVELVAFMGLREVLPDRRRRRSASP